MKLCVHWVNATRPQDVRAQVELTYRNALLDIANGVEHVKRAFDHAKARPYYPLQDWGRFNRYAFRQAVRHLSPSESAAARFQITFDQGMSHGH